MTQAPVPFIAMWGSEAQAIERHMNSDGFTGPRDRRGVAWIGHPEMPGVGEPLFSQVHEGRHRHSMETPACQVCGTSITTRDVPWLITPALRPIEPEGPLPDGRPFVTTIAPTCSPCQTIARRACPHVTQADQMSLLVRQFRIVGVTGDFYPMVLGRGVCLDAGAMEPGFEVYFADPQHRRKLAFMIAKQYLVSIERYRIVSR